MISKYDFKTKEIEKGMLTFPLISYCEAQLHPVGENHRKEHSIRHLSASPASFPEHWASQSLQQILLHHKTLSEKKTSIRQIFSPFLMMYWIIGNTESLIDRYN